MLVADCSNLSFNTADATLTSEEISKTSLPQPDFVMTISEQLLQAKAISPRAPPTLVAVYITSPVYLNTLRIRL